MNIYILQKENFEKDFIKNLEKDNRLFFAKNKGSILKNFLDILEQKKENDIQVILNLGYSESIFFSLLKYIFKIPTLTVKNKNKIDIEKELQHKIAYSRQKDLPVLMYHRVISSEEEKGYYDTCVTKENFEEQIKYLKENNYQAITFEDLKNGEYKRRFDRDKKYVIITFDDGYKDNYENALPILKKYNMKMVLFLITDSKYNEWDVNVTDRPKEKRFDLMDLSELKEMIDSGLVEIGGHTTKHLNMPSYSEEVLKEDLRISKEKIEKLVNKKVVSFAYPWGRNDEKCRKVVKDMGYSFAVSTQTGSSCFSDDLYEIVRVGIYSTDKIEKFKKKVSGNYPFMRENRDNMKKLRNKIRTKLGLKTK